MQTCQERAPRTHKPGLSEQNQSVLSSHPGSENTILHSCRVCNSLNFGAHYFYSIHLSRELSWPPHSVHQVKIINREFGEFDSIHLLLNLLQNSQNLKKRTFQLRWDLSLPVKCGGGWAEVALACASPALPRPSGLISLQLQQVPLEVSRTEKFQSHGHSGDGALIHFCRRTVKTDKI